MLSGLKPKSDKMRDRSFPSIISRPQLAWAHSEDVDRRAASLFHERRDLTLRFAEVMVFFIRRQRLQRIGNHHDDVDDIVGITAPTGRHRYIALVSGRTLFLN